MTPRVAFVTSAAKGLGHAIVRTLLESGWDVCFTYGESGREADELCAQAEQLGRTALALQANLLDKQQVLGAVETCIQTFSRIDALIHNFGPFVFERISLAEYTENMWDRMLEGNLHNFFWIYQAVIGGMRQRAFGRIITVGYAGAAASEGWRFRAAYAAAKSGLASLTRSIAREERQNGITANMVCPGDIRGQHKMQLIREVLEPSDPLGRPPVGEDVARVIAFLCQTDSQQVNGTITEVTGGYDPLAYDDGKDVVKDVVKEAVTFSAGSRVWVYPWECTATVVDVVQKPNRHIVYTVEESGGGRGSFTAYQLTSVDLGGCEDGAR